MQLRRQSTCLPCLELWIGSPGPYKLGMAHNSLVIPALGRQQENQKFKVNYNYSNFKARYTNLETPDWVFFTLWS